MKLLAHGIDFSVCRSTEGVVGETMYEFIISE